MNGLFPLMQEWMILLLKVSNEQEILMSVFGKKELGKKEMDTFFLPHNLFKSKAISSSGRGS